MRIIPYGKHYVSFSDIIAVVKVLKSNFLTQGPIVEQFENSFAKYIGSKYAVALSNGTAALHLSALAMDIKPGDKVITSPITFAASANCVKYCGGEVVFSDIDPKTYVLDIIKLRDLLETSPIGTYKGIILVDFAGYPINMEKFRLLANEFNLWIIEDSCHAPGGYFVDNKKNKQNCGNGNFADLAIFSFHPVKHIAAGEGGMITTNSKLMYEKIIALRSHGIIKDDNEYKNSIIFATGELDNKNEYPGWYMEMQTLGYNYRITDLQSALGLSQLKRAYKGLKVRKQIAEKYYDAFKGKSFIKGQSGIIEGHAYHLYVIEVDNRLMLYNYLKENNIHAQIHYIPCHLMPYYRKFGWKEGDLPRAESYYEKCISLPMFPSLKKKEQNLVINKIISFYEK